MAPPIDFADIQGDILRAYGNRYPHTSYVFVGVPDGAASAGQAWLRSVHDRVVTAVAWNGARPRATFNLAFTCAGLAALAVPSYVLQTFSEEFRQGMARRATAIGDVGDSAPDHWDAHLGTGEAHVLVTINAQDAATRDDAVDELRRGIDAAGLAVVHEDHAEMLDGNREHFGFADGFAQPALEGVNEDRVRGGGVPEAGGSWRALALGEFILGYEDEESRVDRRRRLPHAPAGVLGRSGTYMVWRKLRQDVAAFRRTLRDAARRYEGGDEAKLAAKVVGRWRNGTPLVAAPDAERPDFDPRPAAANDFRYAEADPRGLRCPLGAHIRRSNPRDALGFDGKLTFRHRIIRRGMPYGPRLAPDALEDDGADRGLVFVCFNASLSRQFESIARQWLNDGNDFHLDRDTDFLLGGRGGKMTIQGEPPFFLAPMAPFVSTRGGEYLFVPGMRALAAIAGGATG